jgi:hypothetical protein
MLTYFCRRFLTEGFQQNFRQGSSQIFVKLLRQKFGWKCKEPVSLQSAKKISKKVLFINCFGCRIMSSDWVLKN